MVLVEKPLVARGQAAHGRIAGLGAEVRPDGSRSPSVCPARRTCFRRCSQDCGAGGPSTLQYQLLPLPLGVRAHHDVARLAAFSEAGVPANRTELSVLEPDPRSPFALRALRAGRGAVYTRRALTRAGLYRLTVRAAAPRHQSLFVLLIAVSPYPY